MSKSEESGYLERARHSAAHVMAQAVLEMFPGAKIGIGPAIEDGFYYDFELPRALTPEDLGVIEKRMREIIAEDHPFVREELNEEQARELFADQPYKLELIDGLVAGGLDEYGEPMEGAASLTIYRHGDFVDLCRGPHLESTGRIPAAGLKLMKVAGAYWRGDERNPMLQRIYGTLWPDAKALRVHLQRLAEIEKRDHRRLGRELDLFSVHEEGGAGLIYWHPKGARIRHEIEDYWRRAHFEGGYDLVYSPHIGRATLWQTSGHLDFFRENMYAPMDIDGQEYFLKPMNCPFHILIYKSKLRSYRDLPFRWAELGTVYRYERSGVLHGLLRVRGFTQDDAHIICRPDQVEDEIQEVLRFSLEMLRAFGFEKFDAYLSTKPGKSVGDPEDWERAQKALVRALEKEELAYSVDEGGGAFYGPKIDLKIKDALGRSWQCTTIQFDFNLPERFEMTFIGEDGKHHRPYMVHRALLGSLERFFGVLIEHYAGAFPPWLAPVQVKVIPIADRHNEYAHRVCSELLAAGFRVELDDAADRMQAKIRRAQLEKVPFMLVLGDREAEAGTVNVRPRKGKSLGAMTVPEFAALLGERVRDRLPD